MLIKPTVYHVQLGSCTTWAKNQEEFDNAQAPYRKAKFGTLTTYDPEKDYQDLVEFDKDKVVVDQQKLTDLTVAGVPMHRVSAITINVNIAEDLARLASKPQELLAATGNVEYNTKCEVHMPGSALSMYNEMMLAEDRCTDELQILLNEGWRIIAACPQPTQRRPDYILGRYNPTYNCEEGAKRC